MDREKIPPLAPKWCCCYSISDQSRNRGSKKRKDATSEEISFIKKTHLLKEVQPCYHVQQQHRVRDSSSPVLVWLLNTKPIQKCRSTSSPDTTLWDSEVSRHCPAKQFQSGFNFIPPEASLETNAKKLPSLFCYFVCIFYRGI